MTKRPLTEPLRFRDSVATPNEPHQAGGGALVGEVWRSSSSRARVRRGHIDTASLLRHRPIVLVYAVIDDSLSQTFAFGNALEVFVCREDAERFIEEVRGDDPELAKPAADRGA
jgi:hypothetical protein